MNNKPAKPTAASRDVGKTTANSRERFARYRSDRRRSVLAWLAVVITVLTLLSPAAGQNPASQPGHAALPTESKLSTSIAPSSNVALPNNDVPSHGIVPLNGTTSPNSAASLDFSSGSDISGSANSPLKLELPQGLSGGPEKWTSPTGLSSTLQVMLLLTVLSLAPAVLLMTTCFVRVVVVLSLLRQALGAQQLPPNQVVTSLALFISILIMTPVWKQVYDESIRPYTDSEISLQQAWDSGVAPVRRFMIMQIERTGNSDDVRLFLDYLPEPPDPDATDYTYDDVPLQVLLPAFMLSELKTAFLIGFQIFLPFLILDMVISAVLVSMGMMMMPPVLISLPFKLLLFVLLDGWHLVVGMLLESFEVFL